MTAAQLGHRVGVSQNAMSEEAELAEAEGRITPEIPCAQIANGLNCRRSRSTP